MENTIDIVQLIEKNPITRLNKNYQNKLILKLKEKFNNSEQQLFLTSFFCYLQYNTKSDFIINLDDIWKWIGFSRKDPAKRLLEKYFIKDIEYKILLHQSVDQDFINHGGNNKEQVLLTIQTFKKFCLKADTKKADEIHDYYIKMEELIQETINEETEELKNQLIIKNDELKLKEDLHKNELKIKKHETLINCNLGKRVVYIGEIEENKYIKIGSTKDIFDRNIQLKRQFGNFIFLEVFETEYFHDVEKDILNTYIIRENLYRNPINGYTSKEVVLLSKDICLPQIISITKKYLSKIYFSSPEQIFEKEKMDLQQKQIELENKKLDYDLIKNILNNNIYHETVNRIIENKLPQILDNINLDLSDIKILDKNKKDLEINIDKNQEYTIDENQEYTIDKNQEYTIDENQEYTIDEKSYLERETQNENYMITHHYDVMGRKPKGRKIQKIDPDNFNNLIKVYDSMIYALRCPDNKGFQKSGIQNAVKNNTIYKGFRWNFVNENEDPNIVNIQPTVKITTPYVINTIVKLNATRTKIIDTYCTKDLIIDELKIAKKTLINIIKNEILYNDHYYIEFQKCPQYLIDNYDKPINRLLPKHSKQIKQINPFSKEIIVFNSLWEVNNKIGIAPNTIKKAIENKQLFMGYLWEYYNKNEENIE